MLALVTCYFQPNYGSQLQAYATQLVFDKFGIENETIRIDGLLSEINRAKYFYFLSRIFDINTVQDKMATVRKLIAKKMNSEYAKNLAIRYEKFEEFANTKFKLSEFYNNKKELINDASKYSAFVVGSDQLWLPSNIAADYYTLNFVPIEIPKIALATSFGISKLPLKYERIATAFLRRINHISVREMTGKSIVNKLIGRDVPVVCDPTLMFDGTYWNMELNTNGDGRRFSEKENYIFVYFLGNNPWQREYVHKFQQKTNLKIIQIVHSDEYIKSDVGFADYTPYNVGPKEFVELIRDAEYVFTDSFHCTVFSMLNHKEFFTFPRYARDSEVSTNGRLYSLLSLVKHESRMVNDMIDAQFIKSINYDIIDKELENIRKYTWEWLERVLKESNVL